LRNNILTNGFVEKEQIQRSPAKLTEIEVFGIILLSTTKLFEEKCSVSHHPEDKAISLIAF
jgi:hypothetical protein